MSLTKCFSLNCFATQYLVAFLSVSLFAYLSCCAGCLLSCVGQLIILSSISWHLTKKFRKNRNKELITSFKRAVVVTGCDSGFGNALAHKLNEHGFRVYATVLNTESDGAKDLLAGARFEGKTKVIRMDVTNDEEVKTVYEQIKSDLAQNGEELWALVNNAGIVTYSPLDWGTMEKYRQIFEVNTFGTVRVARTFLPLIRKSKGRIVNLVSMAGRITANNMSIYSMSKHAVISFSDALRRENKKFGIKVSTIEPMAFKTPMASDEYFNGEIDKQWNESSDEVKKVYGEEYLNTFKRLREKATVMFEPSDKVYLVIDKLIEAVRNPEPEIRYPVIPGCASKLFVCLLSMVPTEVYDQMVYHRSSKDLKPALLKNEE